MNNAEQLFYRGESQQTAVSFLPELFAQKGPFIEGLKVVLTTTTIISTQTMTQFHISPSYILQL
jgi:hypothetical protein